MRTTVDIPDEKYRALKTRAAEEGTTVKALVLRGVDVCLKAHIKPVRLRRLKQPVIKTGAPGTLKLTNAMIYDVLFS